MKGNAPDKGRRRLIPLLGSVGLVMLAVAVALVFTEVGLRLFRLAPPRGIATVNALQYERLPGIYAPNQDIVDVSVPALPHRVRIDSLGYRGTSFARQKGDTEVRVLFVGDSFTYGDFVDDSLTLPVQLEQVLGRACRRVRIVNAGLRGSTIVGQHALIQRGMELAPDAVVLMFSENDVTDMADPVWHRLAANRRLKSQWPMSFVYPVVHNTALWNLALRVRATARAREQATIDASPAVVDTAQARRASEATRLALRQRYLEGLERLVADLRSRGVPMVLAIFPSHYSVSADVPPTHLDWLSDWSGENEVMSVDITVGLRASGLADTTLYLLPHDGHPSPTGYRIAAGIMADSLAALARFESTCEGGTPGSPAIAELPG